MGSNRKLLFGVLLVVGAVVLWGLWSVISRIGSSPAPTPPPVANARPARPTGQIAQATVDIPAGSIVTKEMVAMVPAVGGFTSGFITNPEEQAIGYITRDAIPKGGKIRPAEDFVGHISEVGIAGALRPGTRAMVVPFGNKPTLHDLVRIGNFIDVNAAFDGQEARTIIPGVRVLAVDVFGNDFPQVSIAARGPYKADPRGKTFVPPANDPTATPTPTAAPAAAPARPDPALTLELTPEQANTLLLATASGATIDFVVLPALPGNRTSEPIANQGIPVIGPDGNEIESPSAIRAVSVTKRQIAPYAEGKKTAGSGGGSTIRTASTGGNSTGRGNPGRIRESFNPPPPYPTVSSPNGTGTSIIPPAPIEASPTYDIPIYADGKTVRVETVRRPQD